MASKSDRVLHYERKVVLDGSVEPFPRERFLKFVSMLKIQSKDEGLTLLKFNGAQWYILDKICEGLEKGITTFVVLKCRQLGASTLFLALDLFWAFNYKGIAGAFVTHDEGARDQFREQIDLYSALLPKNYRVDTSKSNKSMLVLENSSFFRYLIAGTRGGGNKLGRSGGCNYLHATEVAFWGSADDISSLNQTLSDLYPHRLYVYESTANGFNHYADMWETAKTSPAQQAIFCGWWLKEDYEFSEDHPSYNKYMPQGRKTPLNAIEKERVQKVKKDYGFDITAGQIAWYRYHLENKCGNDQAMMDQEMPWTEEDAFVSTGSQFFTDISITLASKKARKKMCEPFVFRLTNQWVDIEIYPSTINVAELKMWERPVPGAKYVIGCDPAYGSSPEADRTVITVYRCYADCIEQVAEYASNQTSTTQCAWVLAFLGGIYRDVMVNLEINGPGIAVDQEIKLLKENTSSIQATPNPMFYNCLANMRDFFYKRTDSMGGGLVRHWKTTNDTKWGMLNRFKDLFERGSIKINSLHCLEEMRKIVISEGMVIEASGRNKDDRVIATGLAVEAWDRWRRKENRGAQYNYQERQQSGEPPPNDPVKNLTNKFLSRIQRPSRNR